MRQTDIPGRMLHHGSRTASNAGLRQISKSVHLTMLLFDVVMTTLSLRLPNVRLPIGWTLHPT